MDLQVLAAVATIGGLAVAAVALGFHFGVQWTQSKQNDNKPD